MGDLEEQMKQMEEEDEREQALLRNRINQLETEIEQFNQSVLSWREKYHELETRFAKESDIRRDLEKELEDLKKGKLCSTEAISLPQRIPSHQPQDRGISDEVFKNPNSINDDEEVPMGCGNCSKNSRCECIEQAFDLGNLDTDILLPPSKRPLSPISTSHNKRPRQDSWDTEQDLENTEIDFTARYSRQPVANIGSSDQNPSAVALDSCGFCQDNNLCICAQFGVNLPVQNSLESNRNIQTPGLAAALKEPPSEKSARMTGPGTCAQCLADPTSALFCKSLAASRSDPFKPNTPLSNGYQPHNPKPSSNQNPFASSTPVGEGSERLTCADAFKTLSQHPAFDQASKELKTWVPHLSTGLAGLQPTRMEVDALSVMGVLKFFDRRFGRGV